MKHAALAMTLLGSTMLAACGSGETGGAPAQSDETTSAITSSAGESKAGYQLVEAASGFDFAWGLAFLPDGGMLVSEREGQVRYVAPGATSGTDVSGGPETLVAGQGGYLDIAIDPEFESNRFVYLSYSKGTKSENATALMKARLSDDNLTFENPVDIYVAPTKRATSAHYGGRLLFLPDNTLLLGLGDGFRYMDEAQNPQNSHGTVMRLNRDGSAPDDNPFVGSGEGLDTVYSFGHRNVQGLAYDAATDTIYESEHGPKGGDEINILEPSLNYGWPTITYGVNYDGSIITTQTEAPGMEQPIVKWVPSIAPSSIAFVTSDRYPDWQGDILTSALAGSKIQRVDLDKGRVRGEEALFTDEGVRFRLVKEAPDGFLYVTIDDFDAPIYRIEPVPAS